MPDRTFGGHDEFLELTLDQNGMKRREAASKERGDGVAQVGRRAMLRMAGASAVAAFAAAGLVRNAHADETSKATWPEVILPQCEFTYESLVTLEPAVEMGPGPRGIRRYIPITGGTFAGPRIKGVVLPGGADWQTQRADGVTEVDALYSIKTGDGAVIVVHNRGILADGGAYFKTSPRFEAPIGPYDWLNKAVFVGTVAGSPRPGAVVVRVFRVV